MWSWELPNAISGAIPAMPLDTRSNSSESVPLLDLFFLPQSCYEASGNSVLSGGLFWGRVRTGVVQESKGSGVMNPFTRFVTPLPRGLGSAIVKEEECPPGDGGPWSFSPRRQPPPCCLVNPLTVRDRGESRPVGGLVFPLCFPCVSPVGSIPVKCNL